MYLQKTNIINYLSKKNFFKKEDYFNIKKNIENIVFYYENLEKITKINKLYKKNFCLKIIFFSFLLNN